MKSTIALSSDLILAAGNAIDFPGGISSHRLPGASNWWDKAGIVGGYYTNTDPDQGAVAQPDNPGGRASVYQDTGFADVSVEVTWSGVHGANAGPVVCIDPDESEFGLSLYTEYFAVFNQWQYILWYLGKQPIDVAPVAQVNRPAHVDGTPVVLRMEVRGNEVKCYADDVLQITSTVPANLVGSTTHGVSVDVNGYAGRPANLQCAVAPYVVKGI